MIGIPAMIPAAMENLNRIPESKPQSYVIDVVFERTHGPVYRVTDATMEELQDLVCYYHTQFENLKRLIDSAASNVNEVLGYDSDI